MEKDGSCEEQQTKMKGLRRGKRREMGVFVFVFVWVGGNDY